MALTAYQSEKIKNLSFIAIIAVFFIHTDCKGERDSLFFFLQELLQTCSNFAVPLFFIISGYLFFYNKGDIQSIKAGIKKRIWSLFIPYVIWCSLFIVQIWIASQFKTPNNDYFTILHNGEILRFLKRVYIAPPLAFHLWYVRDLMAVVAISPLIFIFQRKRPFVYLIIIVVACGLLKVIPWLSWPLTWFSIGSYFAFSKRDLLELRNKWIGLTLFIGYLLIIALLIRNGTYPTADKWFALPVFLIGIVGLWNVYDLVKAHKYFSSTITEQTFFLYCAHVPFLTIVSVSFMPVVAGNGWLQILTYPLPAIITCVVLIIVARGWKRLNQHSRISSNVYRYLTGGR